MHPRTHRTVDGTVTAYDQGAQLTQWRRDGVPVIWVSAHSRYAEGHPIRGGVPVCWPWFADGPSGDLRPAHGFARTCTWRLLEESAEETELRWAWELTQAEVEEAPGAELFRHAFTARLEVRATDEITVALTVRNDDQHTIGYEAALHSYLHVGDIRQVRVTGLDQAEYYDKVRGQDAVQHGDLTFHGETDRVHRSTSPVRVHDPVLQRTLRVTKAGSPTTVVWNPWADKAAAMEDFGDQEWVEMLCIEAAAVGADAVQLSPGQQHTLSTTIQVAPTDESS